jgi:hypothetical protein
MLKRPKNRLAIDITPIYLPLFPIGNRRRFLLARQTNEFAEPVDDFDYPRAID